MAILDKRLIAYLLVVILLVPQTFIVAHGFGLGNISFSSKLLLVKEHFGATWYFYTDKVVVNYQGENITLYNIIGSTLGYSLLEANNTRVVLYSNVTLGNYYITLVFSYKFSPYVPQAKYSAYIVSNLYIPKWLNHAMKIKVEFPETPRSHGHVWRGKRIWFSSIDMDKHHVGYTPSLSGNTLTLDVPLSGYSLDIDPTIGYSEGTANTTLYIQPSNTSDTVQGQTQTLSNIVYVESPPNWFRLVVTNHLHVIDAGADGVVNSYKLLVYVYNYTSGDWVFVYGDDTYTTPWASRTVALDLSSDDYVNSTTGEIKVEVLVSQVYQDNSDDYDTFETYSTVEAIGMGLANITYKVYSDSNATYTYNMSDYVYTDLPVKARIPISLVDAVANSSIHINLTGVIPGGWGLTGFQDSQGNPVDYYIENAYSDVYILMPSNGNYTVYAIIERDKPDEPGDPDVPNYLNRIAYWDFEDGTSQGWIPNNQSGFVFDVTQDSNGDWSLYIYESSGGLNYEPYWFYNTSLEGGVYKMIVDVYATSGYSTTTNLHLWVVNSTGRYDYTIFSGVQTENGVFTVTFSSQDNITQVQLGYRDGWSSNWNYKLYIRSVEIDGEVSTTYTIGNLEVLEYGDAKSYITSLPTYIYVPVGYTLTYNSTDYTLEPYNSTYNKLSFVMPSGYALFNFTAWNSLSISTDAQYYPYNSNINVTIHLLDPYNNPITNQTVTVYMLYANQTIVQQGNVTTDSYGYASILLQSPGVDARLAVQGEYNGTYVGVADKTVYTTSISLEYTLEPSSEIYTVDSSPTLVIAVTHTVDSTPVVGSLKLGVEPEGWVPSTVLLNDTGMVVLPVNNSVPGLYNITVEQVDDPQAPGPWAPGALIQVPVYYPMVIGFTGDGEPIYNRSPATYLNLTDITVGAWHLKIASNNQISGLTVSDTGGYLEFTTHNTTVYIWSSTLGEPSIVLLDNQPAKEGVDWGYNGTGRYVWVHVPSTLVRVEWPTASDTGGGGGGIIGPAAVEQGDTSTRPAIVNTGVNAKAVVGLLIIIGAVLGSSLLGSYKARSGRLHDKWVRRLERELGKEVKWRRKRKWWE